MASCWTEHPPKGVFALQNQHGVITANQVRAATGCMARAVGFLGRAKVDPQEGLWFPACRSIHMLGMKTSLDIVFLDRNGMVVEIRENLRPWSVASSPRPAWGVLELAPGRIRSAGIHLNDRLSLAPTP